MPQHYLFQLAEQPPNDLPALLNIFRAVPPVIKGRANELLEEIRAGGRRNIDISGSRETVAGLGQTDDTKPVKYAVRSDIQSGSGIVSVGFFLLRRAYRDCLGPPGHPVFPSQTLFGVRQTSYKATNSMLLGAGFPSVGQCY